MLRKILKIVIVSLIIIFGTQVSAMEMTNPNTHCYCVCEAIDNNGSIDNTDNDIAGDNNEDLTDTVDTTEIIMVGDILISEFVSDPVSGEAEWVELYNVTDHEINLEELILEEGSGRQTELEGTIYPYEYIVFEKNSLNNGGDKIILKYQDLIIDSVTYGNFDDGDLYDNAPVANDPYSIIRQNINQDYNIDFQDFVVTEEVTPGEENILFTVQQIITDNSENTDDDGLSDVEEIADGTENEITDEDINQSTNNTETDSPKSVEVDYSQLVITEVFPNPAGSDSGEEFIEIYNYGDSEIDLKGLSLDDEEGGSSPYLIEDDLIISAHGYLAIYNDSSNIILNNSNDSARLLYGDQVINEVSYNEVVEDNSYVILDEKWVWISNKTPGEENYQLELEAPEGGLIAAAMAASIKKTTTNSDYQVVDLTQVRSLEKNTKVQVKGVVSLTPNIFGKQIAYLQGSGIQLYFSKADWPTLHLGDYVEVKGKLSESNGESRILISNRDDIRLLEEGKLLEAYPVTAEEIDEDKEGYLVQLSGDIVDKQSGKIIVADETGEFTIYFKSNSGLSSSVYEVGDKVNITGIVSQYKEEYRVIPRFADDIEVTELAGISIIADDEASSNSVNSWLYYIFFAGITSVFTVIKRKEIYQKVKLLRLKLTKNTTS